MDDEILKALERLESKVDKLELSQQELKTQVSENTQILKALKGITNKNRTDKSLSNNPIDNIKEIIKSELSQVSYETWIVECEGIIKDGILTWFCSNTFTQDILDKRYSKLILNACKLLELNVKEVKILVK